MSELDNRVSCTEAVKPVLGGGGAVLQHCITAHEQTQLNRVSELPFFDVFLPTGIFPSELINS